MASSFMVKGDVHVCRDCGGSMTGTALGAYCENTTTIGNAKDPKDVCEPLGRERRLFCERCGEPVPYGETVCPSFDCGKTANRP
ncbi:hypothetical protein Pla52n_22490 [Stieleria varia]|uniref:Uncharacterized protein n=1 Tax=Stieleria varia TaxID=2528005 RepID=A0A5C6B452_9BACT|nr:hypothetical protein Pla52n_22490 [Stieleria varia]